MERWSSPLLSPAPPAINNQVEATVASDNKKRKFSSESCSVIVVPCSGWYALCFGTSEEQVYQRVQCVARIQPPQGTPTLLNLPLQDSKSKELSSIYVGKLMFLVKDSEVSVSYVASSMYANGNDELACPVQWGLVLQRSTVESKKVHKKTIFCVTCRRLFETFASIQTHYNTAHSNKTEPEWSRTPLEVVYNDDSLAAVVKPQGIAVMGDKPSLSRSHLFMTLASSKPGALRKPVAVHRLDAGTGGLLVLAKTKAAESSLKQSFAERSCKKRYRALVRGRLEPQEGTIGEPISGKPAVTRYIVNRYSRSPCQEWVTTVDLYPETGRRHQLRRHLKSLGHPIWGDRRYGPKQDNLTENQATIISVEQDPQARMCLWAMEIVFPHPDTGAETRVSMDKDPEWLASLVRHQQGLWETIRRTNL